MFRVKIYGLGGQGVVTAAKLLVYAVTILEGRYGKSLPAYGHERRGAPIFADVMIDDQEILLNTFIYQPDIVMLFDPSVIQKGIDILSGIHKNTLLIVNSSHPAATAQPENSAAAIIQDRQLWKKIYQVDATQIALDLIKRNIPNSAMLGALAAAEIVKLESIEQALNHSFGSENGKINAAAARKAYETTKVY